MKNLIHILVFTFFGYTLFIKTAIAFEVKCFWQWGITSDGVKNTMNPDKKNEPVNGEGGYDVFHANDFSLMKGRKKVKTYLKFGNLGNLPAELYTNGKLDVNMDVGALSGKTIVKYKCDKTSIDIINFYKNKNEVKKIIKPKVTNEKTQVKSSTYLNTQCDFKFYNAKINITPDKCVMNIQSFDEPYFTRNTKKIDSMECIKNSDISNSPNSFNSFVKNEKSKYIKDNNKPKYYLTLLFDDSGKTNKGLLFESSTQKNKVILKDVKKSFNGITKAKDANGNEYKIHKGRGNLLIRSNYSEIYLLGDCGPIKTVVNKNTETIKLKTKKSISNKQVPLTALDKAKSTCTDLGFTPKTEKHGDCVMKMIDR